MKVEGRLPASFRDPSGFLYHHEDTLYRQVNQSYQAHFEAAERSGLFEELWTAGLLIRHEAVPVPAFDPSLAWKVIRPKPLAFVSYPYEWSFSQLRDAALATLEVQGRALKRGMSLKDASAYNIQFHQGRPVLVDSLSFEILRPDQPWVAYRQFCQHFIAPLALMALRDIRLGQLLRIHLDGIPLDLASRLLPRGSWARFSLLVHLHLHALSQRRFAGRPVGQDGRQVRMGLPALQGLVDSLGSAVRGLRWKPTGTPWAEYQTTDSYSAVGASAKQDLVAAFLRQAKPRTLWDLGANTGAFSRLGSSQGIFTVAWDLDPGAVERNYLAARESPDPNLLPLLLDLSNPSSGIGWDSAERSSLFDRGPADAMLALALVHHLAIGNNVPLASLARTFRRMGDWLAVEFVPKEDPQTRRLLASRVDIFPDYDRNGFEAAFREQFRVLEANPIPESQRVLFTMKGM
jgi:hypothetical protein